MDLHLRKQLELVEFTRHCSNIPKNQKKYSSTNFPLLSEDIEKEDDETNVKKSSNNKNLNDEDDSQSLFKHKAPSLFKMYYNILKNY